MVTKFKPFTRDELEKLIKEALDPMCLYSEDAFMLLLGTCAQESHFGIYRRQIRGPARGIMQMEPPTFAWLKGKYRNRYKELHNVQFKDLEFNDIASIQYARLRYLVVPKPLPKKDDMEGIWSYYKQYYNSYLGSATRKEFMMNWKKYVEEG